MPLTYHIDKSNNIMTCDLSGYCDIGTINELRNSLRTDPDFSPDINLLFNLLDVTELDLSNAEFQEIADNSPMSKSARRAYVVPTEKMFGMLRIFAGHSDAEAGGFQVFRQLEDAREWLGLDE